MRQYFRELPYQNIEQGQGAPSLWKQRNNALGTVAKTGQNDPLLSRMLEKLTEPPRERQHKTTAPAAEQTQDTATSHPQRLSFWVQHRCLNNMPPQNCSHVAPTAERACRTGATGTNPAALASIQNRATTVVRIAPAVCCSREGGCGKDT